MNATRLLYQEPDYTNVFDCDATLIHVDDVPTQPGANILVLDQTIVYPKGGGQPSDAGVILLGGHAFPVIDAQMQPDRTVRYTVDVGQDAARLEAGRTIHLRVDEARRRLHRRLHTAGHLIADAVKGVCPSLIPFNGNHAPDVSFVHFDGRMPEAAFDRDAFVAAVQAQLSAWIDANIVPAISYPNAEKPWVRVVSINDRATPCGGTHVAGTCEIGAIAIAKIKNEARKDPESGQKIPGTRISYSVAG